MSYERRLVGGWKVNGQDVDCTLHLGRFANQIGRRRRRCLAWPMCGLLKNDEES